MDKINSTVHDSTSGYIIPSWRKNIDSAWDWDSINTVLPGKIRCSDIDGIVELNHHFLILEGKRMGQTIPLGQKILLQRLASLPDFVVLIIFGDPSGSGHPEYFAQMDSQGKLHYTGTNGWKAICEFVADWVKSSLQ